MHVLTQSGWWPGKSGRQSDTFVLSFVRGVVVCVGLNGQVYSHQLVLQARRFFLFGSVSRSAEGKGFGLSGPFSVASAGM